MTIKVTLRADAPIPLNLAFALGPGELLALVGPSGSGKTTTLRAIAGFWRPEVAQIEVNGIVWTDTAQGTCLPPHRRRVGVVFQDYALFPHLTAEQNVAAAMGGMSRTRRSEEAQSLLRKVHLDGLGDRRPAELSGGQKQRVALARALARRPDVLLLDEPFSAVDRATRERLHEELIGLRAQMNMPVVLVTHDLNEAQLLADRMLVLADGKVVRSDSTAAVMADPAALRVMGMREVAALLPAVVGASEPDGLTRLDTATGPIFLPGIDSPPGSRLRVRVLAHEVILAREKPSGLSAQNILPVVVTAVRADTGQAVMVHLAVGSDEIVATVTRRAVADLKLEPGVTAYAILKAMAVARDQIAGAPERNSGKT